jgi:S1-C subfamily serine protease
MEAGMRGACLRAVALAGKAVIKATAMAATAATVMAAAVAFDSPAQAESLSLDELLSGVVRIKTFINPDGTTRENLGREREGTGIVLDDAGLVLTIGYLMVEAHAAEVTTNAGHTVPATVVGYDNETGFGLLQAITPLKVRPLKMGSTAGVKIDDPVLVAAYGGQASAIAARVVAKREFAGSWEYLLDEAIFTAPPHPAWSGAALISHEGRLIGVGSLIVNDATGRGDRVRGNMFVPIDRLPPILADLIAEGHPLQPAHPWLGLNTDEVDGRLVVSRVSPGTPAEKAGLRRGDVIVGVKGERPKDLPDLYRKIWAQGAAGTSISLDVLQDHERRHFDVPSINRLDNLKLKSTL